MTIRLSFRAGTECFKHLRWPRIAEMPPGKRKHRPIERMQFAATTNDPTCKYAAPSAGPALYDRIESIRRSVAVPDGASHFSRSASGHRTPIRSNGLNGTDEVIRSSRPRGVSQDCLAALAVTSLRRVHPILFGTDSRGLWLIRIQPLTEPASDVRCCEFWQSAGCDPGRLGRGAIPRHTRC